MINERNSKYYCREDISLIENYELAVADSETWHCHHRGEMLPCGRFATDDLKKFGLYWRRPASELIFLRHDVHIGMQHIGRHLSEETKHKIVTALKGKPASTETRKKISTILKGRKISAEHKKHIGESKSGMRWWNNGTIDVRAKECPVGYVKGRIA